jgi:hypothetical protein
MALKYRENVSNALHEIAHEIYHNPSKYIDIIRQIREQRAQKVVA